MTIGYDPAIPLWDHQRELLRTSLAKKAFMVACAPGTGKSAVMVHTACEQARRGWIKSVVVIAPMGVHAAWQTQFEAHLPLEELARFRFYVYRSTLSVKRRAGLVPGSEIDAAHQCVPVLLLNTESLSHKSGTVLLEQWLAAHPRTLLVVDEIHRYKTPGAGRTRALTRLASRAVCRRGLSGTPITRGYEDLYAQYRILDPDIIGLRTATEFRAQYCIMRPLPMGGYIVAGYQNLPDLQRKIAPFTYSVPLDVLRLPPLRTKVRYVDLTTQQEAVYRRLEQDALLLLDAQQPVTVDHVLTVRTRLRQVLSGFAPLPDGKLQRLPTNRPAVALDLLDQLEGKVILWCAFREDVAMLEEALRARGEPVAKLVGGMAPEEREADLLRFRREPLFRVLLATPQTGGVGLTLNEAETAVFYTRDGTYEARAQAQARNYRGGQTASVLHCDLLTPGTIDERLRALEQSRDTMNDFLARPPREALRYLLGKDTT